MCLKFKRLGKTPLYVFLSHIYMIQLNDITRVLILQLHSRFYFKTDLNTFPWSSFRLGSGHTKPTPKIERWGNWMWVISHHLRYNTPDKLLMCRTWVSQTAGGSVLYSAFKEGNQMNYNCGYAKQAAFTIVYSSCAHYWQIHAAFFNHVC